MRKVHAIKLFAVAIDLTALVLGHDDVERAAQAASGNLTSTAMAARCAIADW